MVARTIRIDPAFRARIPAQRPEERQQLRDNLLRDGCRDPLVVWEEKGLLLDGHNRFEICRAQEIPYDVVSLALVDRSAALDWIDTNRLGRRNLTPEQFSLFLGRHYNRIKAPAHGRTGRSVSGPRVEDPKPKSAERLAKQYGVSRATVERAGNYELGLWPEDTGFGLRVNDDGKGTARDARRPSTWLPRCSRCGRWIKPPGGAAFGNGKTWCEPCAVEIDLARGEGRTR